MGREFVARNPDSKPAFSIVNLPATIPKPPPTLGTAGQSLWRSIVTEYDISDSGGQLMLEQIALAYERAERLRIEIDRDGEIIRGRTGPREHPGLRGELAARAFVVRALARLGLQFEPVRSSPGRPPGLPWKGRHAD
jgi:hypothetical protein